MNPLTVAIQDSHKSCADQGNASSRTGFSATQQCDIVVVGAGPYGLSAAAHLKATGLNTRIFGRPMDFWATKMPVGMLLRSPRVASNISGPGQSLTLEAYEKNAGISPCAPLPRETFAAYGQWFQNEALKESDPREIASISRTDAGFHLQLQDGEQIRCKRVVIAAGIGPFRKIPPVFSELPASRVSHCYSGCDVAELSRKRVIVIGAGQSALECAALLHEAGGEVEIVARIPALRWIGQHPRLHHLGPVSSLLYAPHDVGPAGISRLVAYPNLVRRIPLKWRDRIRTRAVRPAGSKWLPARLKDVHVSTGRSVVAAQEENGRLVLKLDDGTERSADHVLLGTGYSVDIARYPFWTPQLLREVAVRDGYPLLGKGFESSVPGLHFVGATAARSFGPLLYFVAGTEFSSLELTAKVAKAEVSAC